MPLSAQPDQRREIDLKVGIFDFEPINFIDEKGRAQGLYPDLLQEIARRENWNIEYVPGSWAEGLDRLQTGDIDLMIAIAHSEERDISMDFNTESVIEFWGQVFTLPDYKSFNINDLHGVKVGIMSADISGQNYIDTAAEMGVVSEIIEYKRFSEIFEAVQKGEVIAGVSPQHYGVRHAGTYGLISTAIQFSPYSVYFAVKEGVSPLLLRKIDHHLALWKKNKDSIYYRTLDFWMLEEKLRRVLIPQWLIISLSILTLVALAALLFIVLLLIQVKKKARALLKTERQYRGLVENANSIIVRINKYGLVFFINKFGTEFFQIKKEKLCGENPVGLIFSDGNDINSWIQEGQLSFVDEFFINKNRRIYIHWNNKVITDLNGHFEEIICIGSDISHRLHAEKELKETNKQLEEMVYIASHDLQVPLVSMEGYASELLENYQGKLDDEGQYCLKRLQFNARRMHKLVISLLDISRLNTVSNYFADFSMNDVISKIEYDISLIIESSGGQLYFTGLPRMHADRTRIEGVFRNLIINSFIYGGTSVEIAWSEGIFKISDNGIGIPDSQIDRIFNPGERLKMNRAEGVGMGLTFCRKVVEQHNGTIWVESEEKGKGSVFYIKFPEMICSMEKIEK